MEPGRDIVVEEAPGGFAQALMGLLGNPAGGRTIARNARACVCQRYGWDASLERLDRLRYDGEEGFRRWLGVGSAMLMMACGGGAPEERAELCSDSNKT